MLPHILHSTTRAVAVVQNQTHTIRNVLQLQSSGPSSGSGSNWGNGPGPGGAKHSAGSRFYSGYNSAGRAVTQANAVTSHDAISSQTDENNDDFAPRRPVLSRPTKRQRIRSSSVSMGVSGRNERGEKLGVLKTVQIHTQQKHTFSPVETLALAKEKLLADTTESISGPLLVRRNSTSAPLSPLLTSDTPLPHETKSEAPKPPPVHAEKVQSASTSSPSQSDVVNFAKLPDESSVVVAMRKILQQDKKPSVQVFNAALHALARTRPPGHPLTELVKLYNSMLDKSIVPNVQTYETLMDALIERDLEVHQVTVSLEQRLKRAPLVGRLEVASAEADLARIEKLKEEDNFPSALSLFENVLAIGARDQLHYNTYNKLLLSCANHGDLNASIHIFAQMEAIKDMKIGSSIYRHLILSFANEKKIEEAEVIFESFLEASRKGSLRPHRPDDTDERRRDQIQVWNVMIEAYFRAGIPHKAIELVERIIDSPATDDFQPQDVPIPTSSTFTTVIAGFLLAGDVNSALSWFNKLLGQEKPPLNPYEGLGGKAMRPDSVAWHMMLDALAVKGDLGELNRLYTIYKASMKEDELQSRDVDHVIIHRANMENLKNLDQETALQTLQFLLDDLEPLTSRRSEWEMKFDICKEFVSRGHFGTPCAVVAHGILEQYQENGFDSRNHQILSLRKQAMEFVDHVHTVVSEGEVEFPFSSALILERVALFLSLPRRLKWAPHLLHSYGQAKALSLIPYNEMDIHDWNNLLSHAAHFEASAIKGDQSIPVRADFAFKGISTLLLDIASQGLTFRQFNSGTQQLTLEVLQKNRGSVGCQDFLETLGPSYSEAFKMHHQLQYNALEKALDGLPSADVDTSSSPSSEESGYSNVRIDRYLSRAVEEQIRQGRGKVLSHAIVQPTYQLVQDGLQKGLVPHISSFVILIEQLGRLNELEKVVELYTVAQSVIPTLPEDVQLLAWTNIENSMIIAFGHSERLDAAHTHRLRILEQGGCPSADAYGVLIQHVKDTTDDASAALSLFSEAIERGVAPNLYLYNNMISKLSRARKADYALELFSQMKASGIRPSSITYGAVIGACARVGDIASAESLFEEMTQAQDFKPRIPPYNTMMQMYTTTKPDRSCVLHYLDKMRQAGVKPSSHTYKLLLDAYGSIEPVDLKSMEGVFAELQQNEEVSVTSAHYASLINAYGCVNKDFDKAVSVFESIPQNPRAPALDAVVFEAIINAIVAHKRTDLIPVYVSKMSEAGVHMTAYIANFLIKGYANVNDLDQARSLFESLLDPPTGVAAPNNHAPHDPSNSPEVPVMEPVYREPSTWEVMVRAELGAGNRFAAIDLLERLRDRQYPEAVYNRIAGILTDHSLPQ